MTNPGSIKDLSRKLIDACRLGDEVLTQHLVDALGGHVNQTTALEKAVQYDHVGCAKIILSVTQPASKNTPALVRAINNRNLEIAEMLLPYCNINQIKVLKSVCQAGYRNILKNIELSKFDMIELYHCFKTAAHEGHFHCLDLFEEHVLAQDKRSVMQGVLIYTTSRDVFAQARPYVDLYSAYLYCVENQIDAPLIEECLSAEKDKAALTKAVGVAKETTPKRKM